MSVQYHSVSDLNLVIGNHLLDSIRVVDNCFQHVARLGKVFLHVRFIGTNNTNSQTRSYRLHTQENNEV